METRTFKVNGMACVHCKARVEKALTETAGVASATADIESKSVSVTYDATAVTPDALQKAVEAAGYDMEL